MEINEIENFEQKIIKEMREDLTEETISIDKPESKRETDYNSIILMVFSSLIICGLILMVYQFNVLGKKYKTRIAIMAENMARIETKLDRNAAISKELKSLRQTAENQTIIFERALGKIAPLIIPEKYKKKLNQLKADCRPSAVPESLKDLEYLKADYKDYLNSTPPWIQEEQNKELLFIRYALQFFKIKLLYENEISSPEESERILTELYNEMPSSIGKEFQDKHVKLIETIRTDIIEDEKLARMNDADNLVSKVSKLLAVGDVIVAEELEIVIAELEEYENEFSNVKQAISDAKIALKETLTKNAIEELWTQYRNVQSKFKTAAWDNQMALEVLNNLQQFQDYSSDAKRLYEELSFLMIRQNFYQSIGELNGRFSNTENLSINMKLQLLPILKAELANLLLEIEAAPYNLNVEKKEALALMNKVEERFLEIEEQVVSENDKMIAAYNKWALEIIDHGRNQFLYEKEETGILDNKDEYRRKLVKIFDNLLIIDSGILYDPVRSFYHEVYADIMSDLEPENKYQVAQAAIWNSKLTLKKFIEKNGY